MKAVKDFDVAYNSFQFDWIIDKPARGSVDDKEIIISYFHHYQIAFMI